MKYYLFQRKEKGEIQRGGKSSKIRFTVSQCGWRRCEILFLFKSKELEPRPIPHALISP